MDHKDRPWYEQEAYVKVAAFLLLVLIFLGIHLLVPDFFPKTINFIVIIFICKIISFLFNRFIWYIKINMVYK